MFEKLGDVIKAAQPPVKKPINKESLLAVKERLESLMANKHMATTMATLVQHLKGPMQIRQEIGGLKHARDTVKAHGVNRPLLEMINHANAAALGRTGKAMPAIESFDRISIGAKDPRYQAVMEDLDAGIDTEPKQVADWVRNCSDNVGEYLDCSKSQMEALGQSISSCLEALEGGDLPEDALSAQVTALCFDDVMNCFNALLDILPDLDCKVSDPTNADDIDAHQTKLDGMVGSMGPHSGLRKDHEHQLSMGDVPPAATPKTDTLMNLGYTQENCVDLLRRADNVVDEVLGLIGRKDELCANLDAGADMCENCDNDVPAAVMDDPEPTPDPKTDPEPTTDPAPQPATESMTQTDLVGCHVSSHLCCIASAVSCCANYVHNVLSVAQCLCDLPGSVPAAPNGE